MTNHLTAEELASVIAGDELGADRDRHLAGCVACRAEADELTRLVDDRRCELRVEQPDWESMTATVMAGLPSSLPEPGGSRPRWTRPLLAIAAAVVLAVGVSVMLLDRPVAPPADELAVEEILAEMDALLSDDSIPGFELIDPESDELTAYFDNGAS